MLSLRTRSLKCVHLSCLRTLEDERWWQGKPSRSALNQKVSLVKAGKTQHTEHLQVLIRGIDSKDRFIRMELPFLPHPLSGSCSGLWHHQPCRWDGKLEFPQEAEFGKGSFLLMSVWTNMRMNTLKDVCVYESEYVRVCEWVCVWVFYSGYIPNRATYMLYTVYACNSMGHLWIFQN